MIIIDSFFRITIYLLSFIVINLEGQVHRFLNLSLPQNDTFRQTEQGKQENYINATATTTKKSRFNCTKHLGGGRWPHQDLMLNRMTIVLRQTWKNVNLSLKVDIKNMSKLYYYVKMTNIAHNCNIQLHT